MLLDITKSKGKSYTPILSRCRVCGRSFTWNCDNRCLVLKYPKGEVITSKTKPKAYPMYPPTHCGSSTCEDFWKYYLDIKARENVDVDFAKHLYLKRKGLI